MEKGTLACTEHGDALCKQRLSQLLMQIRSCHHRSRHRLLCTQ